MKHQVLGLDINDDHVAAAVVGLRGQEKVVFRSGFAQFANGTGLADVLPGLLEHLGWKQGACICGISLSGISLRNLIIPFTEKRKISQILPLELEDQLLRPVSDQVIEYLVIGVEENQSHLLVTGIEKNRLQQNLDMLSNFGLYPDVVTLATVALALQLLRETQDAESFLLLDTGLHDMNMVIARHGRIAFVRHLVYPDRVYTARPFHFSSKGAEIVNHEEAMECVSSLCNDIKRTMGLFQLESRVESFPERIIISGVMVGIDAFREQIESEFNQTVSIYDLPKQSGVTWTADARRGWMPGVFDHAIVLALQGMRKKADINFLKDEFAPPRLFASRLQMVTASILLVLLLTGIITYMGIDYRNLNARYTQLGDRMNGLFKETFPEATRIVDPLVQMKTKLRDVQAPSISTPIFSGDKRTLNILADISGRVPDTIEIHVSRLVIDKESVMIKGVTDTFNNVNLIQGALRKSPSYSDVAIVSAAAEKDGGMIRFELKLRTAGAS